ncbi:MAG: GNAT family N-acetyltransferase [Xanthomonadales bacterium]|nr:GNAT family N-acetyltransferase [Xanthomonadales bacterium]
MGMLQFRAADDSDTAVIVALVESAYRGGASRAGWTTEADLLDGQRIDIAGVREVIAKPQSRIVLAERQGQIIGCVQLEKIDNHGYFGMFSVRPTEQGGGIGDALLREAERVVRDEFACTTMTCTVISIRAELIAWYQRRGFRSTGEFKPFPYGDARFGLPKRDDLRFEVFAKAVL